MAVSMGAYRTTKASRARLGADWPSTPTLEGACLPAVRRALLGKSLPWAPMAAAVCVLLGLASGCRTSCDDAVDGPAERVTSGLTDAAGSVYESVAWDGSYHEFPPQKRYEFVHGLRGVPRLVQTFVSFSETPFARENGNISEAAGNEVIFEGVDATSIRVRNDTCETFYLRVAASAPFDEGAAGAAN